MDPVVKFKRIVLIAGMVQYFILLLMNKLELMVISDQNILYSGIIFSTSLFISSMLYKKSRFYPTRIRNEEEIKKFTKISPLSVGIVIALLAIAFIFLKSYITCTDLGIEYKSCLQQWKF